MGVAADADDLVEEFFGPLSGVDADTVIIEQFGVGHD